MPPRDWQMRVRDILDWIGKIGRYTNGMTFESFRASDITIDAVVRNLEVIGEAARHIPSEVEANHPEIPWAVMRGIRNILIHEYFEMFLCCFFLPAKLTKRSNKKEVFEGLRPPLASKPAVSLLGIQREET